MKPIQAIKSAFKDMRDMEARLGSIERAMEQLRLANGRIELRQILAQAQTIHDSEFQVFSQFGEDGVIQFLIDRVPVTSQQFIEFGVENYTEANTRFLLQHNNWAGLVIDGDKQHVEHIQRQSYSWRHNLRSEAAKVTRENVNDLFRKNGFEGPIGLLSIDIDGNDYWVWEAIDSVDPSIVVIEYNHRFGADQSLTIPYEPDFQRSESHHTNIYYGASLKALCLLAKKKGYALVGCSSSGVNAFFVKQDLKPDALPELTATQGFVAGQFRESRTPQGDLAFLSIEEEQAILKSLPLINVEP